MVFDEIPVVPSRGRRDRNRRVRELAVFAVEMMTRFAAANAT